MNFSKSNVKSLNATNDKVFYTESQHRESLGQVWLWLKKFWQFSLFYGDYLGSLHSQKK